MLLVAHLQGVGSATACGAMRWDTDKAKCLSEEYREKSILWDLRGANYKDNRKKLKLWEELATKFECSVQEAKEKFTNLRTDFRGYRKKSGPAKCDQWVHFPSLCFLLQVDAPKRTFNGRGYCFRGMFK